MAILTVTGGTAAVGTTTVATNLAVVLARLGRRVIILDLAPAPGTVSRRLEASVHDVTLPGRAPVSGGRPSLSEGPHGLRILASATGGRRQLPGRGQAGHIVDTIGLLAAVADFVVVDLPADHVALDEVAAASDRVIVVTKTSAASISSTHGLVRHLCGLGLEADLGIVVNGVANPREASWAYRAISAAATPHAGSRVESYGLVAADPHVPRAQMMRRAVVDCRPHAPSSRCFDALGRRIAQGGPFGGGGVSVFPLEGNATGPAPAMGVRQCA